MNEKKRMDLTTKYCDLWGATLLNLITQAGAQNVIDNSILDKTQKIMDGAIKNTNDIVFHHKKLMQLRSA